jgi:hypothetical protein
MGRAGRKKLEKQYQKQGTLSTRRALPSAAHRPAAACRQGQLVH